MLPLDSLQFLELAGFVFLAAVSVAYWWRRRTEDSVWLAMSFAILATAVLLGRYLPAERSLDSGSLALERTVVVGLGLFPYCLFRFSASFVPPARRRDALASIATVLVLLATIVVPRFPAPGDPAPAWFVVYTLAFVAAWTLLSVLLVGCLWRAARGHPAVARRRMHLLGAAAVALNVGLILLATGGGSPSVGLVQASRVLGLSSAGLFLVAFAPPRSLRTMWRREDLDRLRSAEAELVATTTSEEVGAIVLPQAARLLGCQVSLLTDVTGAVLASHGWCADPDGVVVRLAAQLEHPSPTGGRPVVRSDLVAIPVRSGWLAVRISASTPFFGSDELLLLETLGHLTGLAIDRAELVARETAARDVLAEREAQLAEAQRTAQLGSYSWDLATNDVTWSAELYRVLGFTAGAVRDHGVAFASRLHPDDRPAVLDAWASARQSVAATTMEFRVVLPDGDVRWLHGRVHPTLDESGLPVKVFGTVQDITERRLSEEAIAFQALHDALTRLPNRSLFLDRLDQALERRSRRPAGLAVLFLDLDRFKWLNDSRGHAVGDELLVKVSERLRRALRPGDVVARFGGDEFVVLCEDLPGEEASEAMARRLSGALAEPMLVSGEETTVTVSIGIAYSPASQGGVTAETLLRDADAAMYQAKDRGRDRHETFSLATRQLAVARHETANALRRGMDRGELVVHYQPALDITTDRVVGVEALVRWAHPERGLIPPLEFIPLAEETGLIVPLGAHVLHDACRQVQEWQPSGPDAATVALSVNLAARQLMAPDLCEVVQSALHLSGLDPSLLCLEITESVLLEDAAASARALHDLKELGVRIGVDDFGTGFSSLTYLKRFPVDVLKIDRSFVEGLGRDREDRAIVASVVDLAHAFGLTTVAEGVETVEQLTELRGIGCELGQGYLWSRPLGADDALAWINAHRGGLEVVHPRLTLLPGAGGQPRHRLLIVDDDRAVRDLLRILFDTGDYEVVGEASDGREAIALARHYAPDLVLLDLAMPGMGGLEALPLIRAVAPGAKVAVLSGLDEADVAKAALRLGAMAYVTKGEDPEHLLNVLSPLLAIA